jgi:SAM-dependent methyltransferase
MNERRTPIGLAPGAPAAAAGQDAKKYSTSNPVVLRLLDRWARSLGDVLASGPLDGATIVDVGVGEGLALERVLDPTTAVIGIEYRLDKVSLATTRLPNLAGVVADAGMVPLPDDSADLVTSIEVLEHLTDPRAAVDEFARICRPDGRLVVSVPWEPWFRLGNPGRGKNVARLGNDPEHVQQFTPKRLDALIGARFDRVDITRAFPWLIASATGPRP